MRAKLEALAAELYEKVQAELDKTIDLSIPEGSRIYAVGLSEAYNSTYHDIMELLAAEK